MAGQFVLGWSAPPQRHKLISWVAQSRIEKSWEQVAHRPSPIAQRPSVRYIVRSFVRSLVSAGGANENKKGCQIALRGHRKLRIKLGNRQLAARPRASETKLLSRERDSISDAAAPERPLNPFMHQTIPGKARTASAFDGLINWHGVVNRFCRALQKSS